MLQHFSDPFFFDRLDFFDTSAFLDDQLFAYLSEEIITEKGGRDSHQKHEEYGQLPIQPDVQPNAFFSSFKTFCFFR